MRDEDLDRDVARECQAELDAAYASYLLHDPTINSDIISSHHATRWRAKERQAYVLYVNKLIRAIPLEHLNETSVNNIKKAVAESWHS